MCSMWKTTGTHTAASPNNVVVESSEVAARPDATSAESAPPLTMKVYCSGPPAATPPGTIELTALPTSCAVATSVQCGVDVAMPTRTQTEAKLRISRMDITTNHFGSMSARSWYEPKTLTSAGHTK